MKKNIFTLFIISLSINSFAQVKLALTGGLNLNRIAWNDKSPALIDSSDFTFNSTGQKQGFNIGLLVNIKTQENWVLETGLVYTQKGGTTKESTTLMPGNINFSKTQTFSPSYLQVPLYLMYKSESRKKYKLISGLGGYISTGVGGKYISLTSVGTTVLNAKADREIKFGNTASNDFAKTEIGVGAKIAFLMSENLAFGASFQRSLINNLPKDKNTNGAALFNTVGLTITKYLGKK